MIAPFIKFVSALLITGAIVGSSRVADAAGGGEPSPGELYPLVSDLIARDAFEAMQPVHQQMLAELARRGPQCHAPAFCFSGPVPDSQLKAFEQAVFGGPPSFQQAARWSHTATDGDSAAQGTPITLTYSFVPDGTSIPSGAGEPAANSILLATFDSAFGSRAAWQSLVQQIFARWSELSSIHYVLEPNDDGSPMLGLQGQLGVRGDLRIGGKHIDGTTGANILAFNAFPNGGDMVIDTDNIAFFSASSNNFLGLRNVLAHEHGHGLGFAHVCPVEQNKLMEPFVSLNFDGPQNDDIQNVQRHYGDRFEKNDTAATATSLNGSITPTVPLQIRDVSIDDNSDIDFYSLSAGATGRLSVFVEPVGGQYLEGPQTANCDTGTPYNSRLIQDLVVDILAPNGTTVIASADITVAGQAEDLKNIPLNQGAGTYFVRIRGKNTDSVQLYQMTLVLSSLADPTVSPTPSPTPSPTASPTPTPTPVAANCPDIVGDGSFAQAASGLGPWTGTSTNFGTPACSVASCGGGSGALPRTGSEWVWFGGVAAGGATEIGSMQQTVQIPAGRILLEFYLFTVSGNNLVTDTFRVRIDGQELFLTTAADTLFRSGYTLLQVDISAFGDNQNHILRFETVTAAAAGSTTFNLDDVSIKTCPPATPSPTASPTASASPTATPTPSPTPYNGRPFGDFDSSGCTDLNDFLFLLDNWQLVVDGEAIGLNDFLSLLDNWQTGPSC